MESLFLYRNIFIYDGIVFLHIVYDSMNIISNIFSTRHEGFRLGLPLSLSGKIKLIRAMELYRRKAHN